MDQFMWFAERPWMEGLRAMASARVAMRRAWARAGLMLVLVAGAATMVMAQSVTRLELSEFVIAQQFGRAVSIDGNRVAISDVWGGPDGGIVYVYEFDGTSWVQTAPLLGNPPVGPTIDTFGLSVLLSGDRIVCFMILRSPLRGVLRMTPAPATLQGGSP